MWNVTKLILLAQIALLAAIAANFARDLAYQVHAVIIMCVAGGVFLWTVRRTDESRPDPSHEYLHSVVRAGVIATSFWG